MIPYAAPNITWRERLAIASVDRFCLTSGPKVAEFEERVAEYCGVRYCVAVSSGTAALDAGVSWAAREYEFEYWTVPAISFIATADAVKRAGLLYDFVDINRDTCNADTSLGVEMAGRPIANAWPVITDSAHGFRRDIKPLSCGIYTMSFHAIKNITTLGEGGAVLTTYPSLAQWVREWRNHSKAQDGDFKGAGANYRMTEAQAACGLVQLRRADEFAERKADLWHKYDIGLCDLPLRLPVPGIPHPHLYMLEDVYQRDGLKSYLMEQGIQTQIHYRPIYQWARHKRDIYLPNAEHHWRYSLSIPFFSAMTNGQQRYVIKHVRRFYAHACVGCPVEARQAGTAMACG